MNPESTIEVRDTDHFFYRLDLFQDALEKHASAQDKIWKIKCTCNDQAMVGYGFESRAVTRDLAWGIPLPMEGEEWQGKWFTFGLRQFKVTQLAPKFGLANPLYLQSIQRVLTHGNLGGRLMKMAISQDTSISLAKIISPFIQ